MGKSAGVVAVAAPRNFGPPPQRWASRIAVVVSAEEQRVVAAQWPASAGHNHLSPPPLDAFNCPRGVQKVGFTADVGELITPRLPVHAPQRFGFGAMPVGTTTLRYPNARFRGARLFGHASENSRPLQRGVKPTFSRLNPSVQT
jgi:hypothetical protein